MPTITPPTITFTRAQPSWDGGKVCYDVVADSDTVHRLFTHNQLFVIEEEQRGTDPISGREVISHEKLERWVQQELGQEFHVGQLTACVRSEEGGRVDYDADGATLAVYGDLVLSDSRQRVYTLVRCVDARQTGATYVSRPVSLRIYPETTPEYRKRVFYDYNQEGDHADESRSKWLAPKGYAQRVARELVQRNAHLTQDNVNVVRNRVTSKDHRLAGFNTFASAIDASWGKALRSEEDVSAAVEFLIDFWDSLVGVLPDLGIKGPVDRQEIRATSLVGNAVTIYGYMAVARALFGLDDPLAALDQLKELDDPEWFAFDAGHWKEIGVVVPRRDRRTGDVNGWRVAMSFQTRKAMAEAMLAKMSLTAP